MVSGTTLWQFWLTNSYQEMISNIQTVKAGITRHDQKNSNFHISAKFTAGFTSFTDYNPIEMSYQIITFFWSYFLCGTVELFISCMSIIYYSLHIKRELSCLVRKAILLWVGLCINYNVLILHFQDHDIWVRQARMCMMYIKGAAPCPFSLILMLDDHVRSIFPPITFNTDLQIRDEEPFFYSILLRTVKCKPNSQNDWIIYMAWFNIKWSN